jgi:hypothetical protein
MIVMASRAYRPHQQETFPILTAEETERLRRYGKLTGIQTAKDWSKRARSVQA